MGSFNQIALYGLYVVAALFIIGALIILFNVFRKPSEPLTKEQKKQQALDKKATKVKKTEKPAEKKTGNRFVTPETQPEPSNQNPLINSANRKANPETPNRRVFSSETNFTLGEATNEETEIGNNSSNNNVNPVNNAPTKNKFGLPY